MSEITIQTGDHRLKKLEESGYQVEFHGHAKAILEVDFPECLSELQEVLMPLRIPISTLVRGGGGEHEVTKGLRRSFKNLDWAKHNFELRKVIDGKEKGSTSHEVDHVRFLRDAAVALELEWNNKDPFFDRDLENFKRLHAEGAISVGVIITRGASFQDRIEEGMLQFARERNIRSYDQLHDYIEPTKRQKRLVAEALARTGDFAQAWASAFCSDKYGQATTHWRKLEDRVRRGVGNPCPLLLIGIPYSVIEFE